MAWNNSDGKKNEQVGVEMDTRRKFDVVILEFSVEAGIWRITGGRMEQRGSEGRLEVGEMCNRGKAHQVWKKDGVAQVEGGVWHAAYERGRRWRRAQQTLHVEEGNTQQRRKRGKGGMGREP